MRSDETCNCTDGRWRIAQFEVGALIKYLKNRNADDADAADYREAETHYLLAAYR